MLLFVSLATRHTCNTELKKKISTIQCTFQKQSEAQKSYTLLVETVCLRLQRMTCKYTKSISRVQVRQQRDLSVHCCYVEPVEPVDRNPTAWSACDRTRQTYDLLANLQCRLDD